MLSISSVGQPFVFRLGTLLGDSDHAEAGVVAARFLQLLVLIGSEQGSGFGKGLVDFDGGLLGVDGDVRHFSSLSLVGL